VEEQRTNLVLNSATFQPTSGGFPASYTVDQIAPDGTTTASRQTAATTRTFVDYTGIANAQYTFSFYVRATSGTQALGVQLKNAGTDTIITTTNFTATTSWQRISVTGTTNGATAGARIELTGVTNGTILWGAQLEAGAFPTSYIPTTTAAVTRSADVCSISGSNFSAWYRQDEGTVFAEALKNTNSLSSRLVTFNDGTAAEQIRFNTSISTNIRPDWQIIDNSSVQANITNAGEVAVNTIFRVAGGYALNSFASVVNGVLGTPDTSGTVPSISQLNIAANEAFTGIFNGTIRRITYWPTRLPNSTLQAVTQ
jgi:hypothetical protein